MLRARDGFSLMETMVSIAVMVTVSAVVVPSVNDAVSTMRINEAQSSLNGWEQAVTAFKADVKHYPGTNTQMTRMLIDSDRTGSGGGYPPGHSKNWSGPYIQAIIPAGGLPISVGVVRDQLGCDEDESQLILYIDGVRVKDAAALNDAMDGELDRNGSPPYLVSSTGRLRYSAAANATVTTVEFRTPGC
jgi:prepilin-type N-terminal cleavage/methylation domain-containing protein